MTRLAEICILAHGWRRALILVVAGALAGLSAPPFFVLPVLFFALPVWVWCLDGAEAGTGWRLITGVPFRIGFSFGLGYFLVAIHWIGGAFFVDGGWLLAVMPFAVLALAAVLALFWGLASALAHLFWASGPWRLLALATALTAAEFLRGRAFTGFPFDLLGYALTANEQMIQLASVTGVYGLTFIAALIALTPALIWPADDRPLTVRLAPFFGGLLLLAAQLGYGQYRLGSTVLVEPEATRLRLVQPNIPQAVKWQAGNWDFVLERLLSLSEARTRPGDPGLEGVTQVIWPESAFPFYLSDYPEGLARMARMLPPATLLVTGAPRLDSVGSAPEAFNSVVAINSSGEIIARYDKTHLVPFGEYLPFGDLFARLGLKQFVPGSEGWSPGESRRLLAPDGQAAFLPLICYEIIFSGDLGPVAGAAYMLNLTNDGWFDGTIGPAQHFHHARVRAAEEGLSLVRVANTGITALVDPLGRVTAAVAAGQAGVIDVIPPLPLPQTLFATWRHWPLLAVLTVSLILLGWKLRQSSRRTELA